MATALRDRAQRIYEKYGNVMLDVAGMTKAGIERKATCRALFSKLLYLAGAPGAPAWQMLLVPAGPVACLALSLPCSSTRTVSWHVFVRPARHPAGSSAPCSAELGARTDCFMGAQGVWSVPGAVRQSRMRLWALHTLTAFVAGYSYMQGCGSIFLWQCVGLWLPHRLASAR